jgi:hypothetical protein
MSQYRIVKVDNQFYTVQQRFWFWWSNCFTVEWVIENGFHSSYEKIPLFFTSADKANEYIEILTKNNDQK